METNILLRLQIVEKKEDMASKELMAKYGAGTSAVLRLCKPWWGTNRVVCGDLAFASVKTAVACRQRGLHFVGLVKTAHRMFPKKFLDNVDIQQRGDFVAATATGDDTPVIAHCWNDRKRKHLVSTCGTTLDAEPHRKKRYHVADNGEIELTYREVKHQQVVELYFGGAPAIDIHNHNRQGGLALEMVWGTQTWWHRVLATMLGIIETNAFLAMRLFKPTASEMSHHEFVRKLAKALINNPYREEGRQYGGRRQVEEEEDEGVEGVAASEDSSVGCAVLGT